jgi:hypothetical protein
MGSSSLRLWLPFRVSPVRHRDRLRCLSTTPAFAPSEVSRPSASYQLHGATYPRRVPPLTGYVAPPGFLTLSTLCSPHSLPDIFHPSSAHGLSLRGFNPHTTPYAFSGAGSSRFLTQTFARVAPSRIHHAAQSPPTVPRVSQVAVPAAPLGFSPCEVSCPLRPTGLHGTCPPLSRFPSLAAR